MKAFLAEWLGEFAKIAAVTAIICMFFLPFFVWGSQSAPQFFGSVVGAGGAVAAVVIGALWNAQLQRRRDAQLALDDLVATARVAEFELEAIVADLVGLDHANEKFKAGTTPELVARHIYFLAQRVQAAPVLEANIVALCRPSDYVAKKVLTFARVQERVRKIVSQFDRARLQRTPLDDDDALGISILGGALTGLATAAAVAASALRQFNESMSDQH